MSVLIRLFPVPHLFSHFLTHIQLAGRICLFVCVYVCAHVCVVGGSFVFVCVILILFAHAHTMFTVERMYRVVSLNHQLPPVLLGTHAPVLAQICPGAGQH